MPLSRILKLADSSQGFSEIKDAIAQGERVIPISGLAGSGKALLLAHLKKKLDLPFFVITAKPEEALKIHDDLISFLEERTARLFPAWEVFPYEMKSPDSEIIARRLETLGDLATRKNVVVVSAVRSCLEKTILPEDLKKKTIRLRIGENVDIELLSQQLLSLGFKRFPQVEEVGSYSIRGGIVDVFPYSYSDPIRIEFFGDQIESIRKFAVLDQRSIEKIDSALILPSREVMISDEELEQFLSKLGPKQAENIREKIRFYEEVPGLEWLSSLFGLPQAQILDYLPPNSILFLDEPSLARNELDLIQTETERLFKEAENREEAVPEPKALFGNLESFLEGVHQFQVIENLSLGEKKECINLGMMEPEVFGGSLELLRGAIRNYKTQRQKVYIFCDNIGQKDRLSELLDHDAEGVNLEVGLFNSGFSFPEIALVTLTDHQIFSRYFRRRRMRRFNEGIALSSYSVFPFRRSLWSL